MFCFLLRKALVEISVYLDRQLLYSSLNVKHKLNTDVTFAANLQDLLANGFNVDLYHLHYIVILLCKQVQTRSR